MKKSLLLIFILVSFRLFSQTSVYHPFTYSNGMWNQGCVGLPGSVPVYEEFFFFLAGDTIIANVSYKKVFSSGYKHAVSTCCYYYNKYEAAIRQDAAQRKIYYRGAMSANQDKILYDFSNLNIGDTLPATLIQGTTSNFISAIDSVLVGSTYRTQYHIGIRNAINSLDSNYAQLIEGIGSTQGLFVPIMPPGVESGCWLNCYSENSMSLYTTPGHFCDMSVQVQENLELEELLNISPNPSSGIFTINAAEQFQCAVYDVFGREVLQSTEASQSLLFDLSAQTKGIYIVRGKSNGETFSRKIILQ